MMLFLRRHWWLALLLVLVLLQLHNVHTFPVTRGFDATAHIEYLTWIATHHSLPLPRDGWEFHQPPLYYLLVFSLPTLKLVQAFGVICWGVQLVIIWRYFTKIADTKVASLLTTCAATLPLGLYLAPSVGNEFFSSVAMTAALAYYISVFVPSLTTPRAEPPKQHTPIRRPQLILGVLLGLALLSKVTAVVLLGSLILERLWASWRRPQRVVNQLLLPLTIALCIGGWFYIRNLALYSNPFYQAADYTPLSSYAQPIVSRNISFFTNFTPILQLKLFEAHYTSFPGGTLFSWFYDGHGVMLPVQPFSKAGSILVALWLPVLGLALLGVRCWWDERHTPLGEQLRLIPVYTTSLLAAYIQYNFRLPFYSTVKASFIASLILPFFTFVWLGIRRDSIRHSVLKYGPAYLALIVILTVRHFWISTAWYG